MERQEADIRGGDGDQLLGTRILPGELMDGSGDGSMATTTHTGLSDPSSTAALTLASDSTSGDSMSSGKMDNSSLLFKETMIEVCVKMVVCRKYITKTINSTTGQVVHTSSVTEEDPPTVVDVHSYTTTNGTASRVAPSASIIPTTTPPAVSTVQKRPGRPRKHMPVLKPVLVPKAVSTPVTKNDRAITPQDVGTVTVADPTDGNAVTEDKSKNVSTKNSNGAVSGEGKSSDHAPSLTAKSQNVVAVSEERRAGKASAVKRGRGRPSRVIKKPRKYLDVYVEDIKKADPDASEDEHDEKSKEDDESVEIGEEKVVDEGEEGGMGENGEQTSAENNEVQTTEDTENGAPENGSSKTECPKCRKKFSTVSNCVRHMHSDKCSRDLQCGFCDKQFSSRELLERHEKSHRDQECENNFRCSDCNRTYATRNGYLKHKRQGTCYKRDVFHEDGTQGEFECNLCHVRFTTEKLLGLHTEKVHENPNNEYKCPDCGRMFYSKIGFQKHTAKKSCSQPHQCKVCGKKYSNKARESFKSHMRYHLAETSGVQFQCEDCGRVYMTDMALKKHRLTSHSSIKPYKCSTCSKTFPMRYMVRDHERSHTGEKPFLCNLCGTSFGNRGHLYRHMRSHTYGTLHKRGRPRKCPPVKPMMLSFKEEGMERKEGEETFGELVKRDEEEMGVVEIKASSLQQNMKEEMPSSLMDAGGPTYITVHTIDGQLTDQTGAPALMEGPHVVMETPGGMTDNMVLQVIRDLTGATTVYQQVADNSGGTISVTTDDALSGQQPQIIMSTTSQHLLAEHAESLAEDQHLHADQLQELQSDSSPQVVQAGGHPLTVPLSNHQSSHIIITSSQKSVMEAQAQ